MKDNTPEKFNLPADVLVQLIKNDIEERFEKSFENKGKLQRNDIGIAILQQQMANMLREQINNKEIVIDDKNNHIHFIHGEVCNPHILSLIPLVYPQYQYSKFDVYIGGAYFGTAEYDGFVENKDMKTIHIGAKVTLKVNKVEIIGTIEV